MYAGLEEPAAKKLKVAAEGAAAPDQFIVTKMTSETLRLMQSAVMVTSRLQPGDKVASDRDYKFTYIPSEWKGHGTWYQRAPWKGKGRILTFKMNRDAMVYVTRRPDKKFGRVMREQGFKGTGKYLKGQFGRKIQKLPVIKKRFEAGEVSISFVGLQDVAPTVFIRPLDGAYVEAAAKPPTSLVGSLKKLRKHVTDPKKCSKAIALVVKLLSKDQIKRDDGGLQLFQFLRQAMDDPNRAMQPALKVAYLELFETVARKCSTLCTPKQLAQIDVWKIWTITRDELSTDESFEFSRAVKTLQALITALPPCVDTADPVNEDGADLASEPVSEDDEPSAAGEDDEDDEDADDGEDAESDDEDGDADGFVEARRAAVFACVDQARLQTKYAWAKTTVDVFLKFVTDTKETQFTPEQQALITSWTISALEQARLRKQSRAQGKDNDGGKEGRSAFEVSEKYWEGAKISARASVVGGGRQSQGGQDGKMFGQDGGVANNFI